MRKGFVFTLWIALFLFSWSPLVMAKAPKMILKEHFFDAREVKEGELITHTFRVLNGGDETLRIRAVTSDWGCITADFDKAVPPGGEGSIDLRITTTGYEGLVDKRAKIYSNDPRPAHDELIVKAVIRVPIHVSTHYILLAGAKGEVITKTVEVRAELQKPLNLEPSKFNLEEKLTYEIEEVEKGRKFHIHFRNLPDAPARYHGYLKLKTNYPEKPELTIRIRARFGVTS